MKSNQKQSEIGLIPLDATVEKLGDYIDLIIDHRGKTPKKLGSDWVQSGIEVFSAKNVNAGRIVNSDFIRYVTEEIYKKWMPIDVEDGDIFLVSEGATLGEYLYWDKNYPIVLGQRLFCIRTNSNKLYSKYLYSFIRTERFQSEIINRATGSSVLGLRQTEVKKLRFPLIPLSKQKLIGDIDYNINKKIELNKKVNQTLEQIAQTIYKSWFVDFDPVHVKSKCKEEKDLEKAAIDLGISKEVLELFPSEFEERKLGDVPKGWEISTFDTIAKLSTKSIKPQNAPSKLWTHYSLPAYDDTKYPVYELGSEIKSNKYLVDKNAILSSKLNPTTERTWLPNVLDETSSICSTEFMQFIPLVAKYRTFVYCLIRSESFQFEIRSRVTGTTGSRQRAQPKEVAIVDILKPDNVLIEKFCEISQNIFSKILTNQEEIKTLQKTRDTLLPKLLNGEIEV